MTNAKTPTETVRAGAVEAIPNDTPNMPQMRLEQAFIRGLLACPARIAAQLLERVDQLDFHAEQHRLLLSEIAKRAHALLDEGDKDTPVNPVALEVDLMRAGVLDKDSVREALLECVTGDPAAPSDLVVLTVGLRAARVRRACVTVGGALVDAAAQSDDELALAIRDAQYLPSLALRAGLEVA